MADDAPTAALTQDGGCWLLTLEGEHDLTTVPLLERRMEQVVASGTTVIIDLSRTAFIDCSVVAWLVRWSERARSIDHLHMAIVSGEEGTIAKRMFDLLDLEGRIPWQATRPEAMKVLGAES